MKNSAVYLDNNATTQADKRVPAEMLPYRETTGTSLWKRQEIILLFPAPCNNPAEKFHSENDTYPAIVTGLAGLLQKPSAKIIKM